MRSPVCLALTANGIIDTPKDFNKLYLHLVDYNLYIYSKMHAQTRSFRVGCIGAIKPLWIRLLGDAFREFFDKTNSKPMALERVGSALVRRSL
ncbi:hypothetical protein ALQ56_200194 [Pseudomonas syringae pv. papulans]|nr:hypothetical protein ALQ56_200194 [Pseudomonas syringae pv. papulans]